MKTPGWLILTLFALFTLRAPAADRQMLSGHVPAAVASFHLAAESRLPATNRLRLTIGLPLHHREALANLLRQLYDPASTNFHQYLTAPQFAGRFGPTAADYETVLEFARTNGLTVTATYHHRQVVEVEAAVADIEKAFHVRLWNYPHPTENRLFYAPDVEPSVAAGVPIQNISGLNNYYLPKPASHRAASAAGNGAAYGTGPGGELFGEDFRNAYVPGVSQTGSGQYVGLVEFDGYYPNDITTYENEAGLPHVLMTNVVLTGSSGEPDNNTNYVAECSLDIEMVICMAPGLSELYVFEGTSFDSILGSMADHPDIHQFSASWVGFSFDSNGDGLLQTMAAQGQTFFQASGDGCAYTQPITGPCDDPFVTSCGGTALVMDSTGTNFGSESVWNSGFQVPGWGLNGDYTNNGTKGGYWGSGGGVSSTYSLPYWQQNINTTAAGLSGTKRNIPDVAMNADNIYIVFFNGLKQGGWEGTSLSAPLWAGFNALVNQQAASQGKPADGFINPAVYQIGEDALYASCFHDTINGNDEWPGSPNQYKSAPSYDLCTGWGSPVGAGLINALTALAGPVYVDFNYSGGSSSPLGTVDNPFSTLAQGTNAVASGGTIFIITGGSSAPTKTISKPMTITAQDGAATIIN